MNFNNIPNECGLHRGKQVWLSRSVAVAVLVTCTDHKGDTHVLISKRGIGTPDFQGYWNIVCGYLDYNETLIDAARREVYEETGVFIPEDSNIHLTGINDSIEGKQNVTIQFRVDLHQDELPSTSILNAEENEVEDILWIPYDKHSINHFKFAFNHMELLLNEL